MMIRQFLVSFLLFPVLALAQGTKEPVQVTDMLKIRSISGITLSTDGSRAAFTVTSMEPDPESKWEFKYQNQVWMTALDGTGAPRQLTTREGGSSQPAWSPDGRQLAFVRSVEGKSQVFIMPLDGGEAWQLTRFKYGATAPRWSPDGRQILFASSLSLKELLRDSLLNPDHDIPRWPAEKPGISNAEMFRSSGATANPDGSLEEVRAYLESNASDKKARVLDRLNIQDEMDINPEMSFTHYLLVPVQAGAQPHPVTRGFYRFSGAEFTPDGSQLVISGNMDSTQHPDRSLENEIFLVRTDGSQLRTLLGETGRSFSSPRVSPSGKWLAFLAGTTSFVNIPVLGLMPLQGQARDIVYIPFDRNKANLVWSADEKYLYFIAQSNGGAPLYRVNTSSRQVENLGDFNSGVTGFDLSGNRLVYAKTEVANPHELFVADAGGRNVRQLSHFNSSWVADKQLSFPQKHSFTNAKGQQVEYWVMKPSFYQPGRKYPLLLEIHGGPSAMWGPGETSMWHEFQFFCSRGYGVVYCNPRGSGGYGTDFLRANINDWGTGPSSEVLQALDLTVAEGWADSSRLLVSGGSYAGYLVAWIIGHDQRFKAACSQRGVYDLGTFFGEGNAWRLVPNYFGGYPWEPATRAILQRESPISYVDQIRTPYIIFHGDNDRRTGFVEGEMLYRSLKVLGRPVEYVRHPNATHEITRSGNNRQRIDQMLRTWEFFERWLKKS
jgi:dipeptidyl aminopeptidase/acylaminoacyl peptidase